MNRLTSNYTMLSIAICLAVLGGGCSVEKKETKETQIKPPEVEKWRLHAYSWEMPAPGVDNITGFIWIDLTEGPGKASYALDPAAAAARSKSLPPGRSAVFVWKGHDIVGDPRDQLRGADGKPSTVKDATSPWTENKTAVVAKRLGDFLAAYKAAGGTLDYLVLDQEESLSMWALKDEQIKAIYDDPRFEPYRASIGNPAEIRKNCLPPQYRLGEDLSRVVIRQDKPFMKWNRLMQELYNASFNKATYEPTRALFPQAKVGNYDSYLLTPGNVYIDVNGHLCTNIKSTIGNCASPQLYGYSQFEFIRYPDGKTYGVSPFGIFRWQMQNARAIRRSNPGTFTPWVSHKSWTGDEAYKHQNSNNDYYQELIYHTALLGAENFLYWNPAPWVPSQDLTVLRKESDDLVLDSCLKILNRKFDGNRPACVSLEPIDWNTEIIATGAKIGNEKTLWRISVPRWDSKIRVKPSGEILSTGKLLGTWYESKPGETPSFELVK